MTPPPNITPSRTRLEIGSYLGLVYAGTLAIALALPHAHIAVLFAVLVPVTSVGILTFTVIPAGQRRALWHDIGLARAGLSSWAAALLIPVLLTTLAYGTALLLGTARFEHVDVTGDWLVNGAIYLASNLVLSTVFILGEEIGWRGYLLPRVQRLTDRRRAAVVTGFLHSLVHLPLILLTTVYDVDGNRWLVAPIVVVTITGAGVIYAWFRDRSGTVWPVAIAHNAANTVFDIGAAGVVGTPAAALAYTAGESGLATLAAVWLVAGLLLARAGIWQRAWDRAEVMATAPAA